MRRRPRRADTGAEDYGLLFPVATTATEDAARYVRELLRINGIRATASGPRFRGGRRCLRVLVFPEDAAHAYAVICTHAAAVEQPSRPPQNDVKRRSGGPRPRSAPDQL
ncbi:hypothetical protein [Nocardia carnea]|uniref:hypothetical protein n=1 Tax=Nocardia carnea TaxID=37328 RepID=UPI0024540647|nr:hypothetical protein [Nocardia carnea]